MQSYADTFAATDNVRKSGSTQPYAPGEAGTPGSSGAVPAVVGAGGPPVVVRTGATNNG